MFVLSIPLPPPPPHTPSLAHTLLTALLTHKRLTMPEEGDHVSRSKLMHMHHMEQPRD
jgi:hypothetical protein